MKSALSRLFPPSWINEIEKNVQFNTTAADIAPILIESRQIGSNSHTILKPIIYVMYQNEIYIYRKLRQLVKQAIKERSKYLILLSMKL